MYKLLTAAIVLTAGFANTACAGTAWGKNENGVYRVGDEAIRFFAVSFEASLYDGNQITQNVQEAIQHFNNNNLTHVDNDYNGGFFETNLGSNKVFVIGWYNVKTGSHGYMATIPGSQTVRMNDGSYYNYDRGGWTRKEFLVNGTKVYLQLGSRPNVVKWQVGL